jgi:hypothetical protein
LLEFRQTRGKKKKKKKKKLLLNPF